MNDVLKMIIQGTTGIEKSSLIQCTWHSISTFSLMSARSPLLLFAPTCIVVFNVQGKTIHSTLEIPIKGMKHWDGKS